MDMAAHIEHTLLKPEATVQDIIKLCQEAKEAELFGVCINPCYVALAKHLLTGTKVKIITVIGFPLGATYSEVKALETKMAIENHADEALYKIKDRGRNGYCLYGKEPIRLN